MVHGVRPEMRYDFNFDGLFQRDPTTPEEIDSNEADSYEADEIATSETDSNSDNEIANMFSRTTISREKVSITYLDDDGDSDPDADTDNKTTTVFSRSNIPSQTISQTSDNEDSDTESPYPNISPHKAPLDISLSNKPVRRDLQRLVPMKLFAEEAANTYKGLNKRDTNKCVNEKNSTRSEEYFLRSTEYELLKVSAKSLQDITKAGIFDLND
jgi:hypothetical protein